MDMDHYMQLGVSRTVLYELVMHKYSSRRNEKRSGMNDIRNGVI